MEQNYTDGIIVKKYEPFLKNVVPFSVREKHLWFKPKRTYLVKPKVLPGFTKVIEPQVFTKLPPRIVRDQKVVVTTYPPIYPTSDGGGGGGPTGPRTPRVFPAIYMHDELSERDIAAQDRTYTHYRILVTNGGDGQWTGTFEIELYETVGGPNVAPLYSHVADASSYDLGTTVGDEEVRGPPNLAFDGDPDTGWLVLGTELPAWISIQFDEPVTVKQYAVGSYVTDNQPESRSFRTWRLEGSNDGVYWDVLHTVVNEDFATYPSLKRYTLT